MSTTQRIYVGTIGEGVFRSLDGGATFARAMEGTFVEDHVRALVVHPQDDRLLYLGTASGLLRSRDGADSWQRVAGPLEGMQIWSLLIPPQEPDCLIVGTCPARVFRSLDGGNSWQEGATSMAQACPRIIHARVTTLAADPLEPETLWAGVEIDGLHGSRDFGRTWERMAATGISSQDIHDLAFIVEPSGLPRMFAATNRDLNVSDDGGQTFKIVGVGQGLPWNYCRSLHRPLGRPSDLILGIGDGPPGSQGGVGCSTDGGRTWKSAVMPAVANSTIWNFASHPSNPNHILSSSVSGQLFRSLDGGDTWTKLTREFGEIRALAWTP